MKNYVAYVVFSHTELETTRQLILSLLLHRLQCSWLQRNCWHARCHRLCRWTLTPIISPGGNNAELYCCRKGYLTLNVMTVCDTKMFHKYH
ncbi:hypothetical protein E2C01_041276 [Portunus trituberculatus]|uniref:Uncharacterized protein n=1 Tax=Portunus trituberculatus TaxID=210409 RepID=A0A5B7FQA0_PORTR|nr:hypothetical protein [Portunus trituberculatus]